LEPVQIAAEVGRLVTVTVSSRLGELDEVAGGAEHRLLGTHFLNATGQELAEARACLREPLRLVGDNSSSSNMPNMCRRPIFAQRRTGGSDHDVGELQNRSADQLAEMRVFVQ
jgi:hypothetical protein